MEDQSEFLFSSYEEALSDCYNKFNGCSWEFWREKALIDYDIPHQYFDLTRHDLVGVNSVPKRNIEGHYRYLEIASKIRFLPQSAVFVKGDAIGGIFEAYEGILQSLIRNDRIGIDLFVPRLRKEIRTSLEESIRSLKFPRQSKYKFGAFFHLCVLLFGQEEAELIVRRIPERTGFAIPRPYYPGEREVFVESLVRNKSSFGPHVEEFEDLLYLTSQGCFFAFLQALERVIEEGNRNSIRSLFLSTIRSGNVQMLERMFPYRSVIGLPEIGQKITDLVQPKEFDSSFDTQGIQYPLPQPVQTTVVVSQDYLLAAAYSGNPLFVDYFFALGAYLDEEIKFLTYLLSGYRDHGRIVGSYQIFQMFVPPFAFELVAGSSDIDFIRRGLAQMVFSSSPRTTSLSLPGMESNLSLAILENLGQIDILLTFLPLLHQELSSRGIDASEILFNFSQNPILNRYPLTRRILQNYRQ